MASLCSLGPSTHSPFLVHLLGHCASRRLLITLHYGVHQTTPSLPSPHLMFISHGLQTLLPRFFGFLRVAGSRRRLGTDGCGKAWREGSLASFSSLLISCFSSSRYDSNKAPNEENTLFGALLAAMAPASQPRSQPILYYVANHCIGVARMHA